MDILTYSFFADVFGSAEMSLSSFPRGKPNFNAPAYCHWCLIGHMGTVWWRSLSLWEFGYYSISLLQSCSQRMRWSGQFLLVSGVGNVLKALFDEFSSEMWCLGKEGCKDGHTVASTKALSAAEKGLYEDLNLRPCTPVTNVESRSRLAGTFQAESNSHETYLGARRHVHNTILSTMYK